MEETHNRRQVIDKLISADLRNIAKRVQDGKPLSREQLERLRDAKADAEAGCDYVKSIEEIAALLGVTERTIHNLKHDGLSLPVKTAKGYSVAKIKSAFKKYQQAKEDKPAETLKDRKLAKEIERITVNIEIDNERLQQAHIETQRQQGELMPVAEHKQKMIAAAKLYVTSIEQGIENASTQMRSAEMRAVLEKVFNAVRKRVANTIET